jgi:hypothetical protein
VYEGLVQLVNGPQLGLGDAVGTAEVEWCHLRRRRVLRLARRDLVEQRIDFLLR